MFDRIKQIRGYSNFNTLNNVNDAVNWFTNNVRKLSVDPNSLIKNHGRSELATRFEPGYMYLYNYDPKHKETLPYYDVFPLVIPIGPAKNGFYALNFHYLDPKQRLFFMEKLMKFADGEIERDGNIRFKLQWQFLKDFAKYPEVQVCIKHYLFDHVKSRFLKIHPKDWAAALFLPCERFKKENQQSIWRITTRIIKQ